MPNVLICSYLLINQMIALEQLVPLQQNNFAGKFLSSHLYQYSVDSLQSLFFHLFKVWSPNPAISTLLIIMIIEWTNFFFK